jgi:hypothetical protein
MDYLRKIKEGDPITQIDKTREIWNRCFDLKKNINTYGIWAY